MRANQARLGAGIAALASLWIAVYWWWEPAPEPAIRFDTARQTPPHAPPQPPAAPDVAGGERQVEAAPPMESPEAAGVLPPDFYDYVVQEHDRSLHDIARNLLGDAEAWVVIAQANPYMDPQRLKAGQVWQVPLDEHNLQGLLVGRDGRIITPPAQRPAPPKPDELIEYVVQPGDSLSLISQRLYGTQRHAGLLFELNRQRLGLRSEDAIRAGQTLRAPKTAPQ